MNLTFLKEAVKLIRPVIESGRHITVYGDYDVDGLTCLLLWKRLFSILGFQNYTLVNYTKRTHSIDPNLPSILLENRSSLCIICDTGCSEVETLKFLSETADILVLDHHRGIVTLNDVSDNLIVVNPAVWKDGVQMSAGCVTYEVIMEYVIQEHTDRLDFFERNLAFYPFLSLYADSAYGSNDYCFTVYKRAQTAIFPPEFSFAQKNFVPTKRFILFSLAPPINAAFRNNRLDIINKLFLSDKSLLSYERNDLLDDLELLRSETRVHINTLTELIEPKIIGEFALVDLSGYLNQSIKNQIIWDNKGLIANRVADKFKCVCVCIVSTGDKYTLSVRDYFGRDILTLMQSTFEVGGHPSAFGGTMTTQEVLLLSRTLERLSTRVPKPQRPTPLQFNTLTTSELETVALTNEFKHPNEVTLVEVPKAFTKLEPTPAHFKERYYQYHITYDKDKIIYVKQESFDTHEKSRLLIQLYKGSRLSGTMVDVS